MTAFIHHPLFRLFFDLTANKGWNGVAMATYTMIILLVIAAITEKRKGKNNHDKR